MATSTTVLGRSMNDLFGTRLENNSGLQKLIFADKKPKQEPKLEEKIEEISEAESEPILVSIPELETGDKKSLYKQLNFPYTEFEYFRDKATEEKIEFDASDFSRTSSEKMIDYFNFQMKRHGWIIKVYRKMKNDYKKYLAEHPEDNFIENSTSFGVFGPDGKDIMYEKKIAQLRYESKIS